MKEGKSRKAIQRRLSGSRGVDTTRIDLWAYRRVGDDRVRCGRELGGRKRKGGRAKVLVSLVSCQRGEPS